MDTFGSPSLESGLTWDSYVARWIQQKWCYMTPEARPEKAMQLLPGLHAQFHGSPGPACKKFTYPGDSRWLQSSVVRSLPRLLSWGPRHCEAGLVSALCLPRFLTTGYACIKSDFFTQLNFMMACYMAINWNNFPFQYLRVLSIFLPFYICKLFFQQWNNELSLFSEYLLICSVIQLICLMQAISQACWLHLLSTFCPLEPRGHKHLHALPPLLTHQHLQEARYNDFSVSPFLSSLYVLGCRPCWYLFKGKGKEEGKKEERRIGRGKGNSIAILILL